MQPSILEVAYKGNYVCKYVYRLGDKFYLIGDEAPIELTDYEIGVVNGFENCGEEFNSLEKSNNRASLERSAESSSISRYVG